MQAKAKRRFGKKTKTAGGHPATACGDLWEGMSAKQEATKGNRGKMAA
jgi:hypothetical protein